MATRFCPQCGQPIEGDIKFCTNCGASVPPPVQPSPEPQQAYNQPQPEPQPVKQQAPIGTKPKSYLVLAILATIFCCLAFGIPGIVFAAKVDNYWNAGDYQGAEDASRKARNWTIAAIVTGLVIGIIYYILLTAGLMATGRFFDNLNY